MARKLASIQTITSIQPIINADAVEIAHVLGWQVVVKKGVFVPGDKCVYFEVDSYLDHTDPRYAFLLTTSYRNNDFMGEGIRIKTTTIRGALSQGLILPLTQFPELGEREVGEDVTEVLHVRKWDVPEVQGNAGTIMGDKPFGIPTTDETRVQSMDSLRQALFGKPYYISTKMDGTSCTIYCIGGQVGVCGRDSEYKDDGKSPMWNYFHQHNTPDKLRNLGRDIVIQGEFCGPKIQRNRIGLDHYEFYVFNIFDENRNLLDLNAMQTTASLLGLNTVPIEEVGDAFPYTMAALLKLAQGTYPNGKNKEGIVVRPLVPEWSEALKKSLSFKVLNNDFLKKEGG